MREWTTCSTSATRTFSTSRHRDEPFSLGVELPRSSSAPSAADRVLHSLNAASRYGSNRPPRLRLPRELAHHPPADERGRCAVGVGEGRAEIARAIRHRARSLRFFFQAEDGIRDLYVTGVQTCALPILFGGEVIGERDRLGDGLTMEASN